MSSREKASHDGDRRKTTPETLGRKEYEKHLAKLHVELRIGGISGLVNVKAPSRTLAVARPADFTGIGPRVRCQCWFRGLS